MLFSRQHDFKILQYPVIALLKLLGSNANLFNNNIIVHADGRSIPLAVTYEQLAMPLCIVFLVPLLAHVLVGLYKRRKTTCLKILAAAAVYLFLRYIFLVACVPFADNTKIFWGTAELLISFIPLTIILAWIISPHVDSLRNNNASLSLASNTLVSGGFFALALFCVTFFFTYPDPGVPKGGRILVDEFHSLGWESVTEPLDTENFGGQRSVYTYYSFVTFLQQFYDVDIIFSIEQYDKLEHYDILVIKTPTTPFSPEIIAAIRKFFTNGGGLLLVGDHTNLFGMSDHLNAICKEWGIEFVKDATFDLRTGGFSTWSPAGFFLHPAVANVRNYKFATSCSLKVGRGVKSVMTGRGLCAEEMDISHVHFFGEIRPDPRDKWGWFIQCAAKEVGRGRVVVFSDSTTFSSFSVLMHDNPEFILGIMEYLNRSNSATGWKWMYVAFSAAFAFWAIYLAYGWKLPLGAILVVFILLIPLAIAVANRIYSTLVHVYYGRPVLEKLDKLPTILIDSSHSTSMIGHFIGLPAEPDNFSGFFLCFQRLGLWPREAKDLVRTLERGAIQAVFIIDPNKPFTKAERKALREYARNRGIVAIVLSAANDSPTLRQLLADFGLRLERVNRVFTISNSDKEATSRAMVPIALPYPAAMAMSISLKEVDGFPTLFTVKSDYYLGEVWVFSDAYLLSNACLGDPGSPPNKLQFELYQRLFALISEVLGQKQKEVGG